MQAHYAHTPKRTLKPYLTTLPLSPLKHPTHLLTSAPLWVETVPHPGLWGSATAAMQ